MRGRAMEAVVFPFSLREVLRHAGREPHKPTDRLTKAERSQLDKDVLDYLAHGGFPEAQGLIPAIVLSFCEPMWMLCFCVTWLSATTLVSLRFCTGWYDSSWAMPPGL